MSDKKIVGIRPGGRQKSGIYFFQFPGGDISRGRKDVAAYLGGGNAVPVHTHVHMDIDPIDEDGNEVGPGDPRLEGFYVDSWQRGSAPGALNQTGDESVNPAGGHDDHGCTPTFNAQGEGTLEVECQGMRKGEGKVGDPIRLATIRIA